MDFFKSAIEVLQTLVIALGAGLGVWGVINLLEGYGNDNPGAKSQGMKQLMAGAGVAIVGMVLVPLLSGLYQLIGQREAAPGLLAGCGPPDPDGVIGGAYPWILLYRSSLTG